MVALCVLDRARLAERRPARARRCTGFGSGPWSCWLSSTLQIVLGAWLRHYGTLPALTTHGLAAAAVLVYSAVLCAWHLGEIEPTSPALVPAAHLPGALGRASRLRSASRRSSTCCPSAACPERSSSTRPLSGPATRPIAALVLASSVALTLRAVPPPGGRRARPSRRSSSSHDFRHGIDAGEPGGRRLKTAVSFAQPVLASPSTEALLAAGLARLAAYVSLTKPRIVVMVLVTVGVGFLLGARGSAHPATLSLTLLGTALVAGSASALNQWMERARDARMRRTANRALPMGRVTAARGRRVRGRTGAPGHGDPARGGQRAGGRRGCGDALALRAGVHAAEALDDAQHGHRRDSRGPAAGDRLGGRDGNAGHRGPGPVPDRLSLAVSPLPGHRLDLPRGLCSRAE